MKGKINWNIVLWLVIIYFFAFERVLVTLWSRLSYLDEILAIITMCAITVKWIRKKLDLNKEEKMVILLWGIVLIIGIISNIFSTLIKNVFYIAIDILSVVKVWLAYYTILIINKDKEFYDELIKQMAKVARMLILVMFSCFIISRFVDIGMNGGIRYGIPSFKYIFNVAGNFGKLFNFLIPLLTVDLYYERNNYKKLIIAMGLIVWISTMRSRAIAFAAIYVFLYIVFFVIKQKNGESINIKGKKKYLYIIPVIILAIIINWNQIIFYFTTSTQARSVLLRYSFVTMEDYFPLGSGFGTYGSDVAATHYSPLYKEYNFNAYNGMKEKDTSYLNDNYWPMIIAQFGLFGAILVAITLFIFTKMNLKEVQDNKYFYLGSLCANGFLLLSSIASKSYCEYSSICVFMLIAIFVKRQRAEKAERKLIASSENEKKEKNEKE